MVKFTIPEEELMSAGHFGCLGCGATLAMRYVLKGSGKRTILSVPACCWAVMPGVFPYSNMNVPMLYTAFECTGASVSGIRAALNAKGKMDINVIGFAGDGGTLDIGIQALSGAVERGDNFLYICYDNEAYMNTGIQRSSSTPVGAWTTTTPVGTTKDWKRRPKKNGVELMVAHKIPYAATASIAYPEDLIRKVKKALSIAGPKYIQIYAPCPTGWRHGTDKTVEIAKLAVESCAFPMYEVEEGKYTINKKPANKKPIKDYFAAQGRFKHLPEQVVSEIQALVDREWKILLKKEECFKDI